MVSSLVGGVAAALHMAFVMGWEILWALVLGFALSGVVQAVVTKGEMSRLLPDSSARAVLIAEDWSGDLTGRGLAVVRPADTQSMAAIMALCQNHGLAVVPQGGRTGLVGGATPSPAGNELVVSLERMDRVRSADPGSRHRTESGFTLSGTDRERYAAEIWRPGLDWCRDRSQPEAGRA